MGEHMGEKVTRLGLQCLSPLSSSVERSVLDLPSSAGVQHYVAETGCRCLVGPCWNRVQRPLPVNQLNTNCLNTDRPARGTGTHRVGSPGQDLSAQELAQSG